MSYIYPVMIDKQVMKNKMKMIEIVNIKWDVNDVELPTTLTLDDCDLDGFEDVEEFLGMVFYEEYGVEPISYDYQLENK